MLWSVCHLRTEREGSDCNWRPPMKVSWTHGYFVVGRESPDDGEMVEEEEEAFVGTE